VSADSDAGPAPSITSATTAECRTICPALIAPLYSHDVRRLSIGLATLVVAHAPATIGSDASTIRQVAVAGQAAPGGGSFEHFSIEWLPVVAPVNDRGQVAFFATLLRSAASEGIFLASGSSITKIAVDGDRAPGGGTLSGFGKHPIPALNAHGSVAFAADNAIDNGKKFALLSCMHCTVSIRIKQYLVQIENRTPDGIITIPSTRSDLGKAGMLDYGLLYTPQLTCHIQTSL